MRLPGISFAVTLALLSASCSKEKEYSDEERGCIALQYHDYDAKKIDQCVRVCKTCMKGNTITCNTSCRLRGAS
jgi:hypothetical protein